MEHSQLVPAQCILSMLFVSIFPSQIHTVVQKPKITQLIFSYFVTTVKPGHTAVRSAIAEDKHELQVPR